jgi:multidrug efflux system outer membrane protein
MPSDLLANRPDIRAAEQQLIGANANIGAARANYFPRIALTGSAGSASTELSGLFKSGSFGWTFAPQAILPLFDYGRNAPASTAPRPAATSPWPSTRSRSRPRSAKWRMRWPARPPSANSCAPSRPWRKAEADRFNLSDLRYRSGTASYLDLLDAQRSLFGPAGHLAAGRCLAAAGGQPARLQNQVALYRVLGGGWSDARPALTARNISCRSFRKRCPSSVGLISLKSRYSSPCLRPRPAPSRSP